MTAPDNAPAEIELLGIELGLVLEVVGEDTGCVAAEVEPLEVVLRLIPEGVEDETG